MSLFNKLFGVAQKRTSKPLDSESYPHHETITTTEELNEIENDFLKIDVSPQQSQSTKRRTSGNPPPNIKTSPVGGVSCPICGKPLGNSEIEASTHVEVCLSASSSIDNTTESIPTPLPPLNSKHELFTKTLQNSFHVHFHHLWI